MSEAFVEPLTDTERRIIRGILLDEPWVYRNPLSQVSRIRAHRNDEEGSRSGRAHDTGLVLHLRRTPEGETLVMTWIDEGIDRFVNDCAAELLGMPSSKKPKDNHEFWTFGPLEWIARCLNVSSTTVGNATSA